MQILDNKEFYRETALNEITSNKIVESEFLDFILGDFLGRGCSRLVFDFKPDPRYVIKIDISNYNANVIEFENWMIIKETKYAKWFAPIKRMSPCGRILLMEKAKSLANHPKKVPAFMSDIHEGNWGTIKGNSVCFDYAISNFHKGLTNKMQNWPRWTCVK